MSFSYDPADESRRVALRSFLRARRDRLRPTSVGLPQSSNRRARGLRREDVAEIAGVSLGWYARFELGQLANVSERLIDSVAGALALSSAEHNYLRALARPLTAQPEATEDQVSEGLRFVVESFTAGPAMLLNSRLDALVVNELARRIEPELSNFGVRSNFAWRAFVDPAFPDKIVDSDKRRSEIAAMLRYSNANHLGEPHYNALIETISEQSTDFVRTWNENEVRPLEFSDIQLRVNDAIMSFSTIALNPIEMPSQSVLFMRPSDPKRFAELIATIPASDTANAE